jgi:Sel1 repeat
MRILTIILSLACVSAFAEVKPGDFDSTKDSADKGNALAQYVMGLRCTLANDHAGATKWYHKAAEQGYPDAQYSLGVCYCSGEGVMKDYVEAYAYFNLAGITMEKARKSCDIVESRMTPSQIEAGQKRSNQLQALVEANKKADKK